MKITEDVQTLTDAKKQVKSAWISACCVGGLTLAIVISNMVTGVQFMGLPLSAWNLLDVLLIFALSFGISRYSRWCAVLMFVYYSIDKVVALVTMQRFPSWLAIIVLYYLFQGIRGTFAYHQIKQSLVLSQDHVYEVPQ